MTRTSLAHDLFPVADPAYLVEDSVEYPVQVNGEVRGWITVAADRRRRAGTGGARRRRWSRRWSARRQRKVIVVAGRLANLVV